MSQRMSSVSVQTTFFTVALILTQTEKTTALTCGCDRMRKRMKNRKAAAAAASTKSEDENEKEKFNFKVVRSRREMLTKTFQSKVFHFFVGSAAAKESKTETILFSDVF